MNNDENKEELEKNVEEEQSTAVSTTENVETANNTETIESGDNAQTNEVVDNFETEEKKEDVAKDSEEYYDEIDYQQKEAVEKAKAKTRGILREIMDWVICFAIAFVIYLLINYFLISMPSVKQVSMYPTINNGDRVLVVRPWLTFKDFEYGDIVTFEAPIDNKYYLDTEESPELAQYEKYTGLTLFLYNFMDINKVNYIKRVIGVAGDHIEIKDGTVYRNGEKVDEPYIRVPETYPQEDAYSDVVVPEDSIYVMGDNREQSKDSRTFGCIPLERVNGKVVCRLFPITQFGKID